ncbi:cilia- and flagella-associated protein 300 [Cotesia typhae]|uniref:cilia- and flagella-associated protein 300 n=1 Tax=Cotesia typhae TaxID=2053667 RepID=UPI003D69B1B5
MDVEPKYTFVSLADTDNCQVNDKNTRELFKKWGMNLSCQKFLFNETFHLYHKYNLAEAFFKDSNVTEKLKIWCGNEFRESNLTADEVEIKQIPCSIMSMTFFDKLKNLDNNIIHATGNIRQKFDDFVDGILVSDNLRAMLLDEESNEYNLYTPDERNEFIFKLFQLLVIGGEYCQYENDLENYLDLTKSLYKDFVRIQKQENKLFITTIVLEVIAKKNDVPYFPHKSEHKQNIGFFLIDPTSREIKTILHQYGN